MRAFAQTVTPLSEQPSSMVTPSISTQPLIFTPFPTSQFAPTTDFLIELPAQHSTNTMSDEHAQSQQLEM